MTEPTCDFLRTANNASLRIVNVSPGCSLETVERKQDGLLTTEDVEGVGRAKRRGLRRRQAEAPTWEKWDEMEREGQADRVLADCELLMGSSKSVRCTLWPCIRDKIWQGMKSGGRRATWISVLLGGVPWSLFSSGGYLADLSIGGNH